MSAGEVLGIQKRCLVSRRGACHARRGACHVRRGACHVRRGAWESVLALGREGLAILGVRGVPGCPEGNLAK